MPLPLDDDAIAILSLEGVPVSSGSKSGSGIFVENEEIQASDGGRGDVLISVPTVLVAKKVFGSLRIDDALVVDGRNYFVRMRTSSDDPALVKFGLREAK